MRCACLPGRVLNTLLAVRIANSIGALGAQVLAEALAVQHASYGALVLRDLQFVIFSWLALAVLLIISSRNVENYQLAPSGSLSSIPADVLRGGIAALIKHLGKVFDIGHNLSRP